MLNVIRSVAACLLMSISLTAYAYPEWLVPIDFKITDDDRIVVGGSYRADPSKYSERGFVLRLDQNGDFDPEFNEGKVVMLGDPDGNVSGIALANDRIYACGRFGYKVNHPAAIWSFDLTGKLEPAFGEAGVRRNNFGEQGAACRNIRLSRSGDLLVSGIMHSSYKDYIAKYDVNGNLVQDFGNEGVLTLNHNRWITGLAESDSGQIIGAAKTSAWISEEGKLLADYEFPFPPAVQTVINSLTVDPVGRVVFGGWVQKAAGLGHASLRVFRNLPNGQPDKSFGKGGVVAIDEFGKYATHVNTITNRSNGKLLGVAHNTQGPETLIVFQLTESGDIDRSFGNRGKIEIRFPGHDDLLLLGGLRFDHKDRPIFVTVTEIKVPGGYKQSIIAARLTPQWQFDPTFGENGLVLIDSSAPGIH